ncbi:MAG: RagB/SusD family nutrient uptake outer membrane protein [Odoribacter sp.]
MNRIYILLIGFSLTCFTSCNYLDVKPVGQVIPESVTEYRAMMVSAYDLFPQYKHLLSVRSDEAFPYGSSSAFNDYISVASWDESNPGTYTMAYPWLMMYKVIFYANSVIADVMGAEVDTHEDTREQLKAEALLLRAYAHFELVNLYAKPYAANTAATDRGVPISVKIDIEQNHKPESIEEVYGQILADIKEGEELMQIEEQPANLRYRFSKKSAKALEARVRLYRSEWELALKAAEELLPCTLANLNDPATISPYYYNSQEAVLSLELTTHTDFAVKKIFMLPGMMDKYNKTEDLRVARYFTISGKDYCPNKGNKKTMKMTFRHSEFYLIAAEAAAHIDGKAEVAKKYLKQLIENRLTPVYYTQKAAEIEGMNRQELINEIADERAREFALEGHRWYDLRRTTRPEIVKVYKGQDQVEKKAVLKQDDPRYTIRFPKEATDNNINLKN